ncbi:hypothetical protein [Paenarthrobacter aromaticivorans]|uniref:hypothetical protein n=1 Tax=Paenarthrobacter aromaticivorans TaxID=2849150 RepID=UPI003A80D00C
MELLNQPLTGQFGNRLIELLDSQSYHTLNIMVAFAKNSGVLRIKNALENFRLHGGTVNVYVGIDMDGTSYEALTALLLNTDNLYVVHSESGQTFHTKIYQLIGMDNGLVVVGSHNLTGGGLWTNFESSLLVPIGGSHQDADGLDQAVEDYLSALAALGKSFMAIADQDDLDRLLENGYILREVAQQVRRRNAAPQGAGQTRLFGNGTPVKLPRVLASEVAPALLTSPQPVAIPHGDEGTTIWFETRAMTGGSRNILDLSMKSLVERGDPTGTPFELDSPDIMRGAVEFFGLNPTSINETKDISINFEGVDFTGNTILFPDGERANGTWRLQIKGTSLAGEKITEAFRSRSGGHYLQYKIVTFTKIQDDYYFMSVFPESELQNFKTASQIVARNGASSSAKMLGLI